MKGKGFWNRIAVFLGTLLLGAVWSSAGITAAAAEETTIQKGIYAEEVELSGMTGQEAEAAVTQYIDGIKQAEITLLAAGVRW